jgi:hypothetical protein
MTWIGLHCGLSLHKPQITSRIEVAERIVYFDDRLDFSQTEQINAACGRTTDHKRASWETLSQVLRRSRRFEQSELKTGRAAQRRRIHGSAKVPANPSSA